MAVEITHCSGHWPSKLEPHFRTLRTDWWFTGSLCLSSQCGNVEHTSFFCSTLLKLLVWLEDKWRNLAWRTQSSPIIVCCLCFSNPTHTLPNTLMKATIIILSELKKKGIRVGEGLLGIWVSQMRGQEGCVCKNAPDKHEIVK